jgi:isopenicillin N synthase-like dioxygenase
MATQLPVLDISVPNHEIAGHLVETISQYGFVYIKNHGLDLPPQEIDDMFQLVQIDIYMYNAPGLPI